MDAWLYDAKPERKLLERAARPQRKMLTRSAEL
jgi:hypothetical protein